VPELERTLGYGSYAFDRYCIAEMDTRADKRQVEGKSTTRAFAPASSLRNLSLSMCYWSRRRGGWRWRRIPTGTAVIICIT